MKTGGFVGVAIRLLVVREAGGEATSQFKKQLPLFGGKAKICLQ